MVEVYDAVIAKFKVTKHQVFGDEMDLNCTIGQGQD